MKRTLIASAFALAMSLATISPATAADPAAGGPAAGSGTTAVTLEQGAGSTAAEPLVTCNYRVWWSGGINIHAQRDRSSAILRHFPVNTVFYGAPCGNTRGGNYGNCGADNLWKAIGGGWVATKCLTRV